jgi:hypothetical protein
MSRAGLAWLLLFAHLLLRPKLYISYVHIETAVAVIQYMAHQYLSQLSSQAHRHNQRPLLPLQFHASLINQALSTRLQQPTMTTMDDDDFGLDSDDDDFLVQAAINIENPSLKRRASEDLSSSNKRKAVAIYPERSDAAVRILKTQFGMEAFRLAQEKVISRLLHGGSAVVVFPTGGGKSLCFQIPALGFDEMDKASGQRGEGEGGITLVVSPLIALMKDQVNGIQRNDFDRAYRT